LHFGRGEIREQRAEGGGQSREQKAESRKEMSERRVENRRGSILLAESRDECRGESRKQRAESRAESREQTTESKQQRAESREQRAYLSMPVYSLPVLCLLSCWVCHSSRVSRVHECKGITGVACIAT
jgi:hypothetical protein